jgi:hypothetical protein
MGRLWALVTCALIGDAVAEGDPMARELLTALYDGTGGPHWTRSDNWLSSDICSWHGVTCTADGSSVEGVDLPANNLTGPLPPFPLLPHLHRVNLRNNALSGRVPSVAALPALHTLLLAGNPNLEGPVPDEGHVALAVSPMTFVAGVYVYVTLCMVVLTAALLLP